MDTVSKIFRSSWKTTVLVLSLLLVTYLLYFHRLGTLLPGYAQPEISTYLHADSWHDIAANPVSAPYKVLLWLFVATGHHSILTTRVTAACFGVLAVVLFYVIIRRWYRFWVVFLSTVLFATSAGFLHAARLGTEQILQMSILAFIAGVLWYYRRRDKRVLIGYPLAALFAILCYIPGMVWFELFGFILLNAPLRRLLAHTPNKHVTNYALIFAVLLAPLLVAGVKNPHILLAVAGLPQNLSTLSHFGSNLLNAILSIGIRSDGNPLYWVGHSPLLNIVELVLGATGAYFYLYRERSLRGVFLVGSTILSLILIGLGGSVGFAMLVPLLYLFIASGLDHLLGQWFTVFPRNPIARATGSLLICVMLFFSVLYHTRSYFVAWPNAIATRQTFSHPQP